MAGCVKERPPSYIQENFSDVIEPNTIDETQNVTKEDTTKVIREINVCKLGDIKYYEYGVFIYHMDLKKSHIVYTPKGEYLKPSGYPRWQFKIFSGNNTIYDKTKKYIDDRQFPNGEEIKCNTINKTPTKFNQFIEAHESLYK